MLRRLHSEQPESFAFTPANQVWAEAQMTKFPEGRQASAIIPLLWRAQEQEGWLTRAAIEHICDMLDMAYIRGLEVATFYFMFQLHPVGSVANIQICGTTSCMICGAEDLVAVCREKIADKPHTLSADGKFSWEEVECIGACANAPVAQIGKDYYEDLTTESLARIIDELAAGRVPAPGPQNGRFASEPLSGLTSLTDIPDEGRNDANASVSLARDLGDTIKRIDGTEVPLVTPWLNSAAGREKPPADAAETAQSPKPAEHAPIDETGIDKRQAVAKKAARPGQREGGAMANEPIDSAPPRATPQPRDETTAEQAAGTDAPAGDAAKPATLEAARGDKPDDLKKIKGVGPKLEALLHRLGFYHFDQIANWTPAEIAWVDENLEGFRGRVSRDDWVAQARRLAAGEETEFSKRAKY